MKQRIIHLGCWAWIGTYILTMVSFGSAPLIVLTGPVDFFAWLFTGESVLTKVERIVI